MRRPLAIDTAVAQGGTVNGDANRRVIRSAEVRAAALGLLAGFATSAVLLAAGEPWYTRRDESAHWIVYWLDFPMGSLLDPVTEWRWNPGAWPAYQLLSTALNGLFLGAAGTALLRGLRWNVRFRRTVLWAIAIEVPLLILLRITGIANAFGPINVPALIAEMAHMPGIQLLSWLGLCCGYVSHLVISDVWFGPVQHPTPVGLALLAASNMIMFVALASAARTLWRPVARLRRRRANARRAAG